jgi:hypothetical protein
VVTSTRSSRATRSLDLGHEVVDLTLGGLDDDLGVDRPVGRMICSTTARADLAIS